MQRGKRSPILRRFRITTRLGGAIPTWSSRSSSRGSWGFRSLLPSPPSTPRVPADTEPRPPGFQRCSRAAAAEKPAAGQRSARVRGGRCAAPGEEPGLRGPQCTFWTPVTELNWPYVWVYFWASHSVPLICVEHSMPMSHCCNFCSSVTYIEIGVRLASSFDFILKIALVILFFCCCCCCPV